MARFSVWTWERGARVPQVAGRESTAHEAETAAEKVFAARLDLEKVAVLDGEAQEWGFTLQRSEET